MKMNLQELQESKKTKLVKRALREHYEMDIDFEKMSLPQTRSMLTKVKGLLKESKGTYGVYNSHKNNAYLKLIMIEQALNDRLNDLRNPYARIVTENEEVLKSQVILAAQDMVDSLQKMLEEVSKMNVEELDAVVNGMKNEFGTEEGDRFSQTASSALSTLQTAITTAKSSLTSALGAVTGESGAMPGGELGAVAGPEMAAGPEMGGEPAMEPAVAMEPPMEEPEPEDTTGAGRERR